MKNLAGIFLAILGVGSVMGVIYLYSEVLRINEVVKSSSSQTGQIPGGTSGLGTSIGSSELEDRSILFRHIASNSCTNNQVIMFDGVSWICGNVGAMTTGTGVVTPTPTPAPIITPLPSGTQLGVSGSGTKTITLSQQGTQISQISFQDNNNYVTGATFANGDFTISRAGLSAINVNLDGRYALIAHDHNAIYALTGHNHDGIYATVGDLDYYATVNELEDHNHYGTYASVMDLASYSINTHNHIGVYSPVGHTHSEFSTFSLLEHTHDEFDTFSLLGHTHTETFSTDNDLRIVLDGIYESTVEAGTTGQYYRGDKTWQELNTSAVIESTGSLYYTDTRARDSISVIDPLTYDNVTGVLGIKQANGTDNGYISSADWNLFNNKLDSVSLDWSEINNGSGVFMNYKPDNIACEDENVLKYDVVNGRWICAVDIGSLSYMSEDDDYYYLSIDGDTEYPIAKNGPTTINKYYAGTDNSYSLTDALIVDNGDGTDTITLKRYDMPDLPIIITDNNNYLTGVGLNSFGDLSLSRNGLSDVSVNLDARYSILEHEHDGTTISGLSVADFTSDNISNWTNDSGYITGFTELDPFFTSSAAYGITTDNIINWDSAFGWGNHALGGYLTGFTELDPFFTSSSAYGITTDNILDWETAFNWGNYALEGYITPDSSDELTNKTGNISMWTNDKGYITNLEEIDPLFAASPAYNITTDNLINWDNAYGWAVVFDTLGTDPLFSSSPAFNITTDNLVNWETAYLQAHDALTIGTSNGLALTGQVLSLDLAGTSSTGALSSADWNIFNDKVSSQWLSSTDNADIYHKDGYISIATPTLGSGANYALRIDETGLVYRDTSSARYKENINNLTANFESILALQPKVYNFVGGTGNEIGVIAEEVNGLGLKDLVIYDKYGRPDGVKYEKISLYLLEVIKKQQLDIVKMQKDIEAAGGTVVNNITNVSNVSTIITDNAPKPVISSAKEEFVNFSVTGLLSTNDIKARVLSAYDNSDLVIKLADRSGSKSFIVQNSDGEKVFGVNSYGQLSLKAGDSNASIGSASVPAGETTTTVYTGAASGGSKVFITAKSMGDKVPNIAVESVNENSFKVKVSEAYDQSVRFDWWIVN